MSKLRTIVGKFDKEGVQGLVDVCLREGMSHLSDNGREQNVCIPFESRRQFCKLHCYLNIHTYLTDVRESFFEVGGRRFSVVRSKRELQNRFPVEMENFVTIFMIFGNYLLTTCVSANINSSMTSALHVLMMILNVCGNILDSCCYFKHFIWHIS